MYGVEKPPMIDALISADVEQGQAHEGKKKGEASMQGSQGMSAAHTTQVTQRPPIPLSADLRC
jgi:hypothetical protein